VKKGDTILSPFTRLLAADHNLPQNEAINNPARVSLYQLD
jgi:hypothetical protein